MEKFTIVLISLYLCIYNPVLAYISTCYHCKYVDDLGLMESKYPFPFPLDSSCISDNPKHELLAECHQFEYDVFDRPTKLHKKDIPPPKSGTGKGENDNAFYCMKVTLDGDKLSSKEQAKMTVRSCIFNNNYFGSYPRPKLPRECYHDTKSNIGKYIDDKVIKSWIQKDTFDGYTDINVCICNKPGCNGTSRVSAAGSVAQMVSVVGILSYLRTKSSAWLKFTVFLACFLYCSSYIPGADARNCFHCRYVDGIETHTNDDSYPFDDSCGTSEPNKELSFGCKFLSYHFSVKPENLIIPNDPHWANKHTNEHDNSSEYYEYDEDPIDNPEHSYSCIKIIFSGKHMGTGNQIKMVTRSCVRSNHDFRETEDVPEILPNKCYEDKKDGIGRNIKEYHIRMWVKIITLEANNHFEQDVDTTVCTCNTDECNGVVRLGSVAPFIFVIFGLVAIINCRKMS